jgi:spore coat polysaccharide biosynthesis protein SpsF
MRTVAIVQARSTSTRLKGKVLMKIAGEPLLAQELRRLRRARLIDEIVVATTKNAGDNALVKIADSEGARWFRGSEFDVLGRYVTAAKEAEAELIVRVTADCPLIDPSVVDDVISSIAEHPGDIDYASNVIKRTYPYGLDVEALFFDTLSRLDRLGISDAAREHVTWFLRHERPEIFLIRSITDFEDNSDLRWTVDTQADLEVVRRLYDELDLASSPHGFREVVAHVRAHWRTDEGP